MRTLRAIATTALALSLTSLWVPAHADDTVPPMPTCTFTEAKVSPARTVTLGVNKLGTVKVTATATGCETYAWGTVEFGPGLAYGDFGPSDADPTSWSGRVELDSSYLSNEDAGSAAGTVYLEDGGETRPLGASIHLKRRSLLDAGYMPNKIKKNKKFLFGAGLLVADWDHGWYGANEGKKVHLQTKTKSGTYRTVKTYRSMRGQNGGSVNASIKLKKTTCFRWVYDGTSTMSPTTEYAGCTKVKK